MQKSDFVHLSETENFHEVHRAIRDRVGGHFSATKKRSGKFWKKYDRKMQRRLDKKIAEEIIIDAEQEQEERDNDYWYWEDVYREEELRYNDKAMDDYRGFEDYDEYDYCDIRLYDDEYLYPDFLQHG